MRAATLKLKTYARSVNVFNNSFEVRRVIFNVMLSILAALAIWYVIILANMVFNIVERKTLEKEALTLSNEVGDLELSYLSSMKSVDINLSSKMGFKETAATFATRKSTLGSVKIAHNEI